VAAIASNRAFGPRASAIETSWDEESQTTPTASIVEGTDSVPFEVSLNGLVLSGGNQRTFPSLQCVP
jgi:hypothetical protein